MNTILKVLSSIQLTIRKLVQWINYAKIVLKNFHNDLIEHDIDKKGSKIGYGKNK